jgi:hypothetical protein
MCVGSIIAVLGVSSQDRASSRRISKAFKEGRLIFEKASFSSNWQRFLNWSMVCIEFDVNCPGPKIEIEGLGLGEGQLMRGWPRKKRMPVV